LASGKGTHDNQQALTTGWTGVTRAEGRAPGCGGLRRGVRSGGRGGGGVPRQAALQVGQERPMDRTPEPIVADLMDTLGQHVLENAADAPQRRQGHGLPALVLGVLIAKADVAVLERENPAIGQGAAVDIPAPGVEDLFRALQGRFAVDHPPRGPE
jgi:hypothetical protein